jgi:hypothetical protein
MPDTEEDMQIMGNDGGESNVKKEQNGKESLRRLKPVVGWRKRRRRKKRRKKKKRKKNRSKRRRTRGRRKRRRMRRRRR